MAFRHVGRFHEIRVGWLIAVVVSAPTDGGREVAAAVEFREVDLRGVEAAGTTLTAHKMGRYRTGQS